MQKCHKVKKNFSSLNLLIILTKAFKMLGYYLKWFKMSLQILEAVSVFKSLLVFSRVLLSAEETFGHFLHSNLALLNLLNQKSKQTAENCFYFLRRVKKKMALVQKCRVLNPRTLMGLISQTRGMGYMF